MHHTLSSSTRQWIAFRLGRLGDVTLATGVLTRLAREQGWSISVVTRDVWSGIFTGNPWISELIALQERDLSLPRYRSFCRRLAAERQGWGLLDLHGTLRSRLLALHWRGPVLRYPKMGLARRLFLTSRGRLCGETLRNYCVTQRYYMAVQNPPPPAEELLPRVWLSEAELAAARDRLDGLFAPGARPLALHPFAANALKAWPVDHWRTLASLLDRHAVPWFALGRGASPFSRRRGDLCNATTIRESCALLACSRALVTGDSGPMHLAAAAGTATIALFGPTTREWGFYPQGPDDIVLESAMPCRPCSLHGKRLCPRAGECMARITPEDVLCAAKRIAAEGRAPGPAVSDGAAGRL